jgi:hypothetical protein
MVAHVPPLVDGTSLDHRQVPQHIPQGLRTPLPPSTTHEIGCSIFRPRSISPLSSAVHTVAFSVEPWCSPWLGR